MNYLLTASYWFSSSLGLNKATLVGAVFGGACLAMAILLKFASKSASGPVDKKYRASFISPLLFLFFWNLFWFASDYLEARFFGARFFGLLGFLAFLAWLSAKILKVKKNYRTEKFDWEKQEQKLKYLPR